MNGYTKCDIINKMEYFLIIPINDIIMQMKGLKICHLKEGINKKHIFYKSVCMTSQISKLVLADKRLEFLRTERSRGRE